MSRPVILVVDDYSAVRETLGRSLERAGYMVFLAASGEEALQILTGHDVDAVVMHLHMPVMSGQTLFHVIIGKWPALKSRVLIMTGDVGTEQHQRWLRLYDLPVVMKPFSLVEVHELIDALTVEKRREANSS